MHTHTHTHRMDDSGVMWFSQIQMVQRSPCGALSRNRHSPVYVLCVLCVCVVCVHFMSFPEGRTHITPLAFTAYVSVWCYFTSWHWKCVKLYLQCCLLSALTSGDILEIIRTQLTVKLTALSLCVCVCVCVCVFYIYGKQTYSNKFTMTKVTDTMGNG